MAHIGQHRSQRIRIARHLKADIEAFLHAQFFLRILDRLGAHIQRQGGTQFFGQFQTIGNHIGNHHIAGAGMLGNGGCHAADGAGTGNEHIFAKYVKRERCVGGVAQRIKTGEDIGWNCRVAVPEIGDRDAQILGICAGAVDTDTAGAHAQVTPARQAVAAPAANQMTLTGNQVTGFKIMHIGADLGHPADKFVSHHHWHRNGLLGPVVPVINVHIRSADGGFVDLYEHIVDADFRNGHLFQPEPRLGL